VAPGGGELIDAHDDEKRMRGSAARLHPRVQAGSKSVVSRRRDRLTD
jgi:hypothetical protein